MEGKSGYGRDKSCWYYQEENEQAIRLRLHMTVDISLAR
jgi:hypothetical protein